MTEYSEIFLDFVTYPVEYSIYKPLNTDQIFIHGSNILVKTNVVNDCKI